MNPAGSMRVAIIALAWAVTASAAAETSNVTIKPGLTAGTCRVPVILASTTDPAARVEITNQMVNRWKCELPQETRALLAAALGLT